MYVEAPSTNFWPLVLTNPVDIGVLGVEVGGVVDVELGFVDVDVVRVVVVEAVPGMHSFTRL